MEGESAQSQSAPDPTHLVDEFVSQDAITLDASSGAPVVDADPGLESLILSDPAIADGAATATTGATGATGATGPGPGQQTHPPPPSGAASTASVAAVGDPILLLSQDQISRLENVLQSEEAKGMLDVVLAGEESGAAVAVAAAAAGQDLNMVDILVSTGSEDLGGSLEGGEEGDESKPSGSDNPEEGGSSSDHLARKKGHQPQRRSQRQIDKEMKEEAERIRLENQARMKKEQEEAERKKNPEGSSGEEEGGKGSPAKAASSGR